ncbi:MAG: cytochrome c oxidase assembly factor Coa1 family protein [Pyrinomonadaceae bacterium]
MMNPNQAQPGGSFQQPPVQQQKGCLARNWMWLLPAGCLGLILGLVALVAGIFLIAMSAMKSSDVYQGALKVAQSHPAAIERMGEPIKDGWFVKGNVKVDAGGGSANLEIPVSGPKKSGTLFVTAVSPDGAWMYERLDLAVEGVETVSLLDRNVVQPPDSAAVDVEEDADDGVDASGESSPDGGVEQTPSGPGHSLNLGANLDEKALEKPEPAYPALAKAARATGKVTVMVWVDESGRVTQALPASGHPLLRQAAVAAARQARFAPELRDGKPVKFGGVLTYTFVLE